MTVSEDGSFKGIQRVITEYHENTWNVLSENRSEEMVESWEVIVAQVLLVTFAMFSSSTGQLKLKMSAVGENPLDPATPESRKRKGSPCDTSGQR